MSTDKQLAATITEALRIRDEIRQKGGTRAEEQAVLEGAVRAAWPFTRTWHYRCDTCCDTGLVMHECRPGRRCSGVSSRIDAPGQKPGKYKRLCVGSETYVHDYGVPCTCSAGARFRVLEPRADDELAGVAKTKKPMTRIGR